MLTISSNSYGFGSSPQRNSFRKMLGLNNLSMPVLSGRRSSSKTKPSSQEQLSLSSDSKAATNVKTFKKELKAVKKKPSQSNTATVNEWWKSDKLAKEFETANRSSNSLFTAPKLISELPPPPTPDTQLESIFNGYFEKKNKQVASDTSSVRSLPKSIDSQERRNNYVLSLRSEKAPILATELANLRVPDGKVTVPEAANSIKEVLIKFINRPKTK